MTGGLRPRTMGRQMAGARDAVLLMSRMSLKAKHQTGRTLRAVIVPQCPAETLVNQALIRPPIETGALEGLRAAYDAAGVWAWSVWVPGESEAVTHVMRAAGYRHTATLPAMELTLAGWEPPASPTGFDIDADGTIETLGRVNTRAHGRPVTPAFRRWPLALAVKVFQLRVSGVAVAALCAIDHQSPHGTDRMLCWVATDPDHRGRGYGTALVTEALRDAKENGCTTSTLQASEQGKGVYQRIGYQPIGAFTVYERKGQP